ncbi:MAG: MBL fold metallo-hydrolase [Cytophagaceae bacterium]
MDNKDLNVKADALRKMLEEKQNVFILDVRPQEQREEWQIPGSEHLDAYKRLNVGDPTVLNEIDIPKDIPVITVCAAGRTSQIAANELRKMGFEAYSLEGGMKAWSLAWNTAEVNEGDLTITQVRRTGKGCLSYVLGSGKEAIVIDASLDPEVYIQIAKNKGWEIKYVLDTHVHADHLSRTRKLSELTGAKLFMPDQQKLQYPFTKIFEGDVLKFGKSELKTLSTPGHTVDSSSYLINEKFLLTGDTLFTDGVGRPDLKASEEEAIKRASLLYKSLQRIIMLPTDTIVLPGHISKPVEFDQSIIGENLEEIKNKVSSLKLSEEDFIKTILSKIPPTPPNYLKVVEVNLVGDITNVDPGDLEAGANRCAIS